LKKGRVLKLQRRARVGLQKARTAVIGRRLEKRFAGIDRQHHAVRDGAFVEIQVVRRAVKFVLAEVCDLQATVIKLNRAGIRVLVIAEVVAAALDLRDDRVAGVAAHVPVGARDHAAQYRTEVRCERQRGEVRLGAERGIVEQQIEQGVGGLAALTQELAFEERVVVVGVAEQGGLRVAVVSAGGNAVTVAQHLAVRKTHVEPVQGHGLDVRIKDLALGHAAEEPSRVHFPSEAVGRVADALVVAWRVIFEAPHRNEFFKEPVGTVSVGHGVLIMQRDGHGEQIAVDHGLVAVAVDDRAFERRPAALHFFRETHHVTAQDFAVVRRAECVAPVIHARGGVDRGAGFARDVEQIAESDARQVFAHQTHRLATVSCVAGHQVNERLGGRSVFQRRIMSHFRVFWEEDVYGLVGQLANCAPLCRMLRMVKLGPDTRK